MFCFPTGWCILSCASHYRIAMPVDHGSLWNRPCLINVALDLHFKLPCQSALPITNTGQPLAFRSRLFINLLLAPAGTAAAALTATTTADAVIAALAVAIAAIASLAAIAPAAIAADVIAASAAVISCTLPPLSVFSTSTFSTNTSTALAMSCF
eukprot:scpid39074/ scgid21200/ 